MFCNTNGDASTFLEAAYDVDNNKCVTLDEYADGATENRVPLSNNCESRIRFVKHDLLILCQQFCYITRGLDTFVHMDLYDEYKKIALNLTTM